MHTMRRSTFKGTGGKSLSQNKLPLVSVVTPSFNQASFIRETIESVMAQDYEHIEHIVVDGGSTDGTLDILRSYSHLGDRFRYVSEPDNGQSHAINKGVSLARGEIIGWLNSDDIYEPGAIRKVVDAFLNQPEHGVVYGKANYIDEAGQVLRPYRVERLEEKTLFESCFICQPAAFIRKDVFLQTGGVNEQLKFCMDYDLWIRISRHDSLRFIDEPLASSRLHGACKSIAQWSDVGLPEIILTSLRHYRSISSSWLYEFLRVKGVSGVLWLLQQMKGTSILGNEARLVHMNRYHDHWVPRRLRMVVTADPANPLRRILVAGSHMIPFVRKKRSGRLRFTVYVNGKRVRRYSLRKGPFFIGIPIRSNQSRYVVDFVFFDQFVPSRSRKSTDRRSLSCVVNEVIPCSAKELDFYMMMTRQPYQAGQWLQEHGNA